MARLTLPLFLIALGVFGLVEHGPITRQWLDMYPDDSPRQNALTRCAQEDTQFNRYSASGRAACYQKYLESGLEPSAPAIAVGVPGAPPSHLAPRAPTVHTNTNR